MSHPQSTPSTPPTPPATSTAAPRAAAGRGRTVLATRPLTGWRTVDLLTVTFLGAAFGIAYWGYGVLYNGPISALGFGLRPLFGLFVGVWFLAGVVGGLVVRRPGAALLCEVVAALVSMLPGTEWGVTTLVAGVLQGLGAELVLALLAYRSFGLVTAVLAGAASAPLEWVYEVFFTYFVDWSMEWKLVYLGTMTISGAVIAGLGGWAVTRALAKGGALGAFPPGQEERERRAV